jgi:citrate synthase
VPEPVGETSPCLKYDEPRCIVGLEGISMAEKKTGGLEGIIAGNTAISTVGKQGVGLTYRGYSIEDLAAHSTFEDVAYLLIYCRLPKADELDDYKTRLRNLRGLHPTLRSVLEEIGTRRPRPYPNRRGQSADRLLQRHVALLAPFRHQR